VRLTFQFPSLVTTGAVSPACDPPGAFGFGEALDLAVGDRDWLLERVGDERQKQARQLERAARGR
jgi:hypothetical protein